MFTLTVAVLVASLHHQPVERRLWVHFHTRFTCEHAQDVIARDFKRRKIITACTKDNPRI